MRPLKMTSLYTQGKAKASFQLCRNDRLSFKSTSIQVQEFEVRYMTNAAPFFCLLVFDGLRF